MQYEVITDVTKYVAILIKYIAIGNHINDINVNAYQFLLVIDDLLPMNYHIRQLMIFVHVSQHLLLLCLNGVIDIMFN